MPHTQSPATFPTVCKEYFDNILSEYFTLSILEKLTEQQADRIVEILQKAETDNLLSFLIDEADHVIGHMLGLIDVKKTHTEQDKLRQMIDHNWITWSLTKINAYGSSSVPEDTVKQAQVCLKEKGLYAAAIDGVCGEKMKEAFQQLEKEFHQYLKQHNLYPELKQNQQNIDTDEAIRLVKEKGIDGNINNDADLLSFGTWLSFC